jgi:hypothetical protein
MSVAVACELIDLINSELERLNNEDERRIVCNRIRDAIAWRCSPSPKPVAQPIKPMTERERMDFEQRVMPFGVYDGHTIVDVPLQYLCHLTDPSPFISDVKRYLANATVKRMMGQEDDE